MYNLIFFIYTNYDISLSTDEKEQPEPHQEANECIHGMVTD